MAPPPITWLARRITPVIEDPIHRLTAREFASLSLFGPDGGPGFLGFPGTARADDSATLPSYGGSYGWQPPDEGMPTPYNPSQTWFVLSYPSLTSENEDAITLLSKDGRPPEQIHNYLLTRTTLYVRDQQRRDITLDQLDLAATQKVNHDAGVDFPLPLTSK